MPKAATTKPKAKAKAKAKSKTPAEVTAAAPAPLVKTAFWVGFDLGGTKMLCTIMDDKYKVLATARKSTVGSNGPAKGIKRIITTITEAISKAKLDPAGIKGIGIGCPGLVNPEKGILLNAPNLGWTNVALRKELNTKFKCPVAVLNDVDAGTYGEYILGAGKGSRSMLGIFPGTGLGAGFVYNGQLIRGKSISCMELGMILLPGTHLSSTHFGTVSLEELTSRLALAAQAAVACYRGQLPDLDERTGGSLREMRSKALAGAFREEEEAAILLFRNSLRYLSMGVAIIVNLLAPDRIVLGGGLVEEMPQLYLGTLKEEVNNFALPGLSKGLRYSIAKLGSNAVAAGALAYLRTFGAK